ncbi:hypothetical protein EJ913_29475 [Azospirillum doebereinerae]|uniref:Uncharacterized protein n=1 Tax=Azospirillum doebereinerae TaxID=92933 RepID=A0A433J027_9PROT|nr:hypothetical protein EJ913_29475 [Azospirillum doebereinerae]
MREKGWDEGYSPKAKKFAHPSPHPLSRKGRGGLQAIALITSAGSGAAPRCRRRSPRPGATGWSRSGTCGSSRRTS